ncbi:hypothetical protein BGX27_000043 [Mortierella sp. AM989]|nr:hypothetical protein BGX27_000043 [Mortierella sp. AM989]
MDATQPEAVSSSTLGDQLATSENVKNLKRKVISVSKLMEVFKNKEIETAALKKQVEEARKEIAELRKKAKDNASVNNEFIQLKGQVVKQTQLTEQAQADARQAKTDQEAAEEKLNRLTLKLRSVEALNTQLEAKTNGMDQASGEVGELQKKLSSMQREHDQANRKMQEMSEMRERLMKAEADKANRLEWLTEQKKKWEKDEKHGQDKQMQELQNKVNELEHQLEDINTEGFVEAEMAKQALNDTEDKLRITQLKLEDTNQKIRSLNKTVLELGKEKGTLERKLATLEHERNIREFDMTSVEEFEEVIPSQDHAPIAKSVYTNQQRTSTLEATRSGDELPSSQLDRALSTIENLMGHFNVLRMVSGTHDDKQQIATLANQVKALTTEKQALQDELTRRLVECPIQNAPATHSSSNFLPPPASPNIPARTVTTSAPISSDTIPRMDPPRKASRKRKVIESTAEITPEATTGLNLEAIDHGPSLDTSQSKTGVSKKTRKSAAGVETSPSPSKPRKPRAIKRATKTSSVDLSHIQIRNISVNPLVPSRHCFLSLMSTSIVDDSQLYTKLDVFADASPETFGNLFEAVQAKAKEIADAVLIFRAKHDILDDSTEELKFEGFDPIFIPKSLCTAEVHIVQLLCLFQRRFLNMDILNRFFVAMYDFILKNTAVDEHLTSLSVLARITTGVCRTQGDIERPRILAFDVLREVSSPKTSLVLCEAIASIWPSVFVISSGDGSDGLEQPIVKAYQAVLSTHQEAIKGVVVWHTPEGCRDIVSFGFDTFVRKCNWPSLPKAPFIDELTEEMMEVVRAPDFMDLCQKKPGYDFALRKALELLIVHGYDWGELCENGLIPELSKMTIHGSLYTFALPLLASVTRETRFRSSESFEPTDTHIQPIRKLMEGILASEATLGHQTQSAMAIIDLSNGRQDHISMVKEWHSNLNEMDKTQLPEVLREIFS